MIESKSPRILYMEDDAGLGRLVQKKLQRDGYVVDLAYDGEEGLAMYASGSYDVIAVDQSMPVHDGLEVISIMASRGPMSPTIMVTGTGNEDMAVKAMKLGARDYIVKDVEGTYIELLPSVIERILRQQCLIEEKQRAEEALRRRSHELGERLKQLNCLYGISELRGQSGISIEQFFQGAVNLIPSAWRYPEITCARVSFEDGAFKTENFQETRWKQTQDIVVHGKPIGSIEVWYLEETPERDEGLFSKEERSLIDAISERLGRIIEHEQAEESREKLIEELQDALAEVNTLSGLLPICASCKKIRDDKGYWNQIEEYIRDHSEAEFSHSICPECAKKLYPELYEKGGSAIDRQRHSFDEQMSKRFVGQDRRRWVERRGGIEKRSGIERRAATESQ